MASAVGTRGMPARGVPLTGGGRVAPQLGVDRGLVRGAAYDETAQQAPAQLGVDGQAVERDRAVEQPA